VIAILAGNQTATNLQKPRERAKEELTLHKHLELKDVYYHKKRRRTRSPKSRASRRPIPKSTAGP